jgi:acyl-CoA thioesterase-1
MFGSIARLFIVVCAFLLPAWAPAAAAGTILVYGDSLSAAYGIAQERGWVALLEARLKREKADYSVANASISGETTSGGLSRMKKALERHKPAITVIELGANDGLRGLPVAEMRRNLAAMIKEARAARSRVLLVGLKMPPNYGADYTRAFEATYTDLAKEYKTGLVPFMFEGVAEKRENFQPDNLHPTAEAQPILLENVWKGLKPMLK